MYLSRHIDEVMESVRYDLIGNLRYKQIATTLTNSFQPSEPFYFGVRTHIGLGKEDLAISGIYDSIKNRRYIVLNFSRHYRTYQITPEKWDAFKFGISQVCQHETIHQLQWQHRGDVVMQEPLDFNRTEEGIDEVRGYLADPDEIDAYAHDIAMEIKFMYPSQDPYTVLRHITRKRKLWSYSYYKDTFKGGDWTLIKNRLLKKTYQWLPYT